MNVSILITYSKSQKPAIYMFDALDKDLLFEDPQILDVLKRELRYSEVCFVLVIPTQVPMDLALHNPNLVTKLRDELDASLDDTGSLDVKVRLLSSYGVLRLALFASELHHKVNRVDKFRGSTVIAVPE